MKFSILDLARAVASSDAYNSEAKPDELAHVCELALKKIGLAGLGGQPVSIDLENGFSLTCVVTEDNAKDKPVDVPKALMQRHRKALRRAVSEAEGWRGSMTGNPDPAPLEEFDAFVREAKEALTILGIKPAK